MDKLPEITGRQGGYVQLKVTKGCKDGPWDNYDGSVSLTWRKSNRLAGHKWRKWFELTLGAEKVWVTLPWNEVRDMYEPQHNEWGEVCP